MNKHDRVRIIRAIDYVHTLESRRMNPVSYQRAAVNAELAFAEAVSVGDGIDAFILKNTLPPVFREEGAFDKWKAGISSEYWVGWRRLKGGVAEGRALRHPTAREVIAYAHPGIQDHPEARAMALSLLYVKLEESLAEKREETGEEVGSCQEQSGM